jgi:molybdopterin/thiamine biosynthesis adenylyltransferase
VGVLGVVPGHIGLVQATEILKLILKIGAPLIGKFYIYNALTSDVKLLDVGRNPDCPLCGVNPSITDLAHNGPFQSDGGRDCGY